MSRTDLDPATLAASLRRMAGDGSVEWVHEPIQAAVLLDIADALEDNAKLREQSERLFDKTLELATENSKLRELMSVMAYCIQGWRECDGCRVNGGAGIITERAGCYVLLDRLRELGVEVTDG